MSSRPTKPSGLGLTRHVVVFVAGCGGAVRPDAAPCYRHPRHPRGHRNSSTSATIADRCGHGARSRCAWKRVPTTSQHRHSFFRLPTRRRRRHARLEGQGPSRPAVRPRRRILGRFQTVSDGSASRYSHADSRTAASHEQTGLGQSRVRRRRLTSGGRRSSTATAHQYFQALRQGTDSRCPTGADRCHPQHDQRQAPALSTSSDRSRRN